MARRKNTFEKKNGSQSGFVGSPGSQVNRVLPGFFPSRSFALPEPV